MANLGFRQHQLARKVRDLWQQKDLPAAEGKVAATVPSHGVVMLRLAR